MRRGSVVARALYYVSLAVAVTTCAFFADLSVTVRVRRRRRPALSLAQSLTAYRGARDRQTEASTRGLDDAFTADESSRALGRLVVVAASAAFALVEVLVAVASLSLLATLSTDYPTGVERAHKRASRRNHTRLAVVAVVKMFVAVCTLATGAALEVSSLPSSSSASSCGRPPTVDGARTCSASCS